MNWKDCLKKLRDAGITLDSKDEQAVKDLVAEGVDPVAAVRQLYIQSDLKVVDLTARARAQGADVKPYHDTYDAVISRRTTLLARTMQGYMDERNSLGIKLADLQTQNREILRVSSDIKGMYWLIAPQLGGTQSVLESGDIVQTEDGFRFVVQEDGSLADLDSTGEDGATPQWPSFLAFTEGMKGTAWSVFSPVDDTSDFSSFKFASDIPGRQPRNIEFDALVTPEVEMLDLSSDKQLMQLFEVMLFQDESKARSGERRILPGYGLKGSTPAEVLATFRDMQAVLVNNLAEMSEIAGKLRSMESRITAMTDREWRNPDFSTMNADGTYNISPPEDDGVAEDVLNYTVRYVNKVPWEITNSSTAEGDLYIRRVGPNAGTPHKERQGPSDIAITFDKDVLLPDYMYYLLQHLQPQIASRAHGTAQQAIRKSDIHDVILDFFQRRSNQVKEEPPRRPQGDLFTDPEMNDDPVVRRQEAESNYKAVVGVVEQGTFKSGFNRITSAEEAAHVLAEIRRNAQEGVWALVLDENDNALGVVEHTKGGIDGTSLYASVLAGHIYQIPGAAKVWIAHNHPSGVLIPSSQDERITKRINDLMTGSGVEVQGHVLFGAGRGSFAHMLPDGTPVGADVSPTLQGSGPQPAKRIAPAVRKHSIPIYTRKARAANSQGTINSPQAAVDILDNLDVEEGVLFLNNRHQVVGVVAMTAEEMKTLRGTGRSRKLLLAQSELNAAAAISFTKEHDTDASSNIASFLEAGDVRGLDHMWVNDTTGQRESMAQHGLMNTHGRTTFNQDLVGITSGLLEAAKSMPQNKGPAEQMIAVLRKQPGVKKEELDWVMVEDWIRAKGYVTRDEIIDFIDKNGVVVEEIHLGEMPESTPVNVRIDRMDFHEAEARAETLLGEEDYPIFLRSEGDYEFYFATEESQDLHFSIVVDRQWDNVTVIDDDTGQPIPIFDPINGQDLDSAHNAINAYALARTNYDGPFQGQARFTHYTTSASFNHREIVFRLPHPHREPKKAELVTGNIVAPEGDTDVLDAIITEMHDTTAPRNLRLPVESIDWGRSENGQFIEFNDVPVEYWDAISAIVDAMPGSGVQMIELARTGNERLPSYTQHHAYTDWDNVLMWMRMAEHVDEKGRRVLMIEEIQSDWHQSGREFGYASEGNYQYDQLQSEIDELSQREADYWDLIKDNLDALNAAIFPSQDASDLPTDMAALVEDRGSNTRLRRIILGQEEWIKVLSTLTDLNTKDWTITDLDGKTVDLSEYLAPRMIDRIDEWRRLHLMVERKRMEMQDWQYSSSISPPDAPFKGNAWAELAMKRAIRFAAEEGFDVIAWTTGEQQNERYGLENYVSSISWDPQTYTLTADPLVSNNWQNAPNEILETANADELRNYVGKEVADQLKEQAEIVGNRFEVVRASSVDVRNNDVRNNLGWIDRQASGDDLADGYVIMDENGELLRDRFDPTSLIFSDDLDRINQLKWRYIEAEGWLPTVSGDDLTVGGGGMRKFYDEILVNLTNRAARKLDKGARANPFGLSIQMDENPMDGNYEIVEVPEEGFQGEEAQDHIAGSHWSVVQVTEGGPEDYSSRSYRDLAGFRRNTAARGGRRLIALWNTEAQAQDFIARIQKGVPVHSLEITTEMSAKAMLGQTLFQDRRRGSITFDEQNKAIIRMTRSRDMSTFLHESGHLYLELMGDIAQMAGASDQAKNDYDKVLNFLGVEHRSQIKRVHHEKFARAFEAYLREGKSPDPGLRDTFRAFQSWLMRIYAKLTKLDVELTKDIRQVFDRLIATDVTIKQARAMENYVSLFTTAEDAGISPEAFEVYRRSTAKVHEETLEREQRRVLDDLVKEEQAWYSDERKKVEQEVTEEANAMPVYIALSILQRGKNPDGTTPLTSTFKLSKKSVLRVLQGSSETLDRLPGKGRYLIWTIKSSGVDAEFAAKEFGFSSATEMLTQILRSKAKQDFIQAETDARMAERFPDPLVSGDLQERAQESVHSNDWGKIFAAELRMLRKRIKQDKAILAAEKKADRRRQQEQKDKLPKRADLALIKAAAKELVAKTLVRDLQPHKYAAAARTAGRKAFAAMERKDYEKAYEYRRQQLVNHEMYRAAKAAKDSIEKIRTYLTKFDRKITRQKMGKAGVLERIDAVLENISLRKISLKEVDRLRARSEILQAIQAGKIVAPPNVVAAMETDGVNYQDMSVMDLMGVRDIVRQLEMIGKNQYEMIVNGEKQNIQDVVDELVETVTTSDEPIGLGVGRTRRSAKAKEAVSSAINAVLRPGAIARILDASGWGAFTRHIIVPLRRAYSERMLPLFQQADEDVMGFYLQHYSDKELKLMNSELIYIEALGETLTKGEMLSIALNTGSETNRKALEQGVKANGDLAYPHAAIQEILAKLDARDWAFIQDIWDYLDTYWYDVKDESGNVIRAGVKSTEQRRRGIAPEKVDPFPFTINTSDGQTLEIRGGYYPLAYDTRHSKSQRIEEFEDVQQKMGNGVYVSSNTRAGATYSRVKNHKKVVLLGLNTITLHLREIIRDVSIGDEVNFVKRVLEHSDLDRAMNETGNNEALKQLKMWLDDAAVGELPAAGAIEHSLAYVRTGFTKAKIAWNTVTMFLQLTGVFQTAAEMGTQNYMKGLSKVIAHPAESWKFIMERSSFMRVRYDKGAWDKDVADAREHLQVHMDWLVGEGPTKARRASNALARTYFAPIMMMQSQVDATTWMAGYTMGMNEGMSEEEAIVHADARVEAAQTSGFFSDRSGLERGTINYKTVQSQFIRIWTTLIGYMLAKFGIAHEKGVQLRRDVKGGEFTFKTAVKFALDMLLLFTLEGLMSAMIYGTLGEPEDDEPVAWWLAKTSARVTAESVVSGIPIFGRETLSARYGGGNTPIGALTKDVFILYNQASQGEIDKAFLKSINNVGGTLFHYPSSQTNRLIEAAWRENVEGEDVAAYEYALGIRDED
jgi:hypothetical protein